MKTGTVTYKRAQRVAFGWHSGKWSPLYAFASTGTLLPGLLAEVHECMAISGLTVLDREDLDALERYILNKAI